MLDGSAGGSDRRLGRAQGHGDGVCSSPGPGRKRSQVVKEFPTFTAELVALRDWLAAEGVTQVVMEATGVYWRPVWHVLEEHAAGS